MREKVQDELMMVVIGLLKTENLLPLLLI